MSIHGECFDNGMSGNCGGRCDVLLRGDCKIGIEMLLDHSDSVDDSDLLDDLRRRYGIDAEMVRAHEEYEEEKFLKKQMGENLYNVIKNFEY